MDTTVVITIATVIAIFVGIGVLALRLSQRHDTDLESRFGREYQRTVKREGRRKGEAELIRREVRVSSYELRDLDNIEDTAFRDRWGSVQGEFVDAPRASLQHADVLLQEVMVAGGYPLADFEQRAADLSVEFGELVGKYRSAQAIALRSQTASTEELRQALLLYRAIFERLAHRVEEQTEEPALI